LCEKSCAKKGEKKRSEKSGVKKRWHIKKEKKKKKDAQILSLQGEALSG
jgi:hypothetical protein